MADLRSFDLVLDRPHCDVLPHCDASDHEPANALSDRQTVAWVSPHELIDHLIQASADLVIDEIFLPDRARASRLRAAFKVSGDERCGRGVKGLVGALRRLGLDRAGRVVVLPRGGGDQFRIELEIDA